MKIYIPCSFICLLFLFSCHQIPDHAKYIPKDAQLVAAIDMKQLGKKLIWNALTGSELFEEMQKNMSNEESKKAMKDISNIGLNQQSSVYFYMNGKMAKQSSLGIVVGMADEHVFEAFLKKTYPAIHPEKTDGYSSVLIEDNLLAAWNKEVAMFFPFHAQFGSDSSAISMDFNQADSMKKNLKAIFTQSTAHSILSNSQFKTLQKEGHDISVWLNYEQIYNNNADPSSNPFIKQEYFKEAALSTGIDFEKGKVSTTMDYYMSKEMAAIYKKYQPGNINMEMIRKMPSAQIDVLAGYNLSPVMMQEYLKKFGLDGLLNMGLGLAGTSMDDIAGTFQGDLLFTISDLNLKSVTDTTNYDENADRSPDMNMTLALNIKNKDGLEKLLGIGVKNKLLIKNGNVFSLPQATDSKAALAYDEHTMVYSTDATITNAYLEGKGNSQPSIPSEVWKHFSTSPMVFFADLKKIMASVPLKTNTEEEKRFVGELTSFFNYVEMYGGKMKNNAVHVEGNLMLSNEKENALIQLLDLGMKAKKMNDAKIHESSSTDSVLAQ